MQNDAINDYRDFTKKEIINGKIYLTAGTSGPHNDVVGNLTTIFKNFLKGKICKVYGEGMNVYFDENNPKVMPDLKIVCDRSKIHHSRINGAPDFIIEILSPSTRKRDMGEKKIYMKSTEFLNIGW